MLSLDKGNLDDGLPFAHFTFGDLVNRWGADVGPYVTQAMRDQAPERTGRLKGSINYEMGSQGGSTTYEMRFKSYGVPYTGYVIQGTSPHIISAVAAKALHFQMGGKDIFAKRVHHPGTKPNDFPARAYEETREYMESKFVTLLDQMLGGQGSA